MLKLVDLTILVAWLLSLVNTIVNLLVLPRLRRTTNTAGPLVSVVIPARNEQGAIESTVRAFLAQTYSSIEVIVVNDRSTDATAQILASFNDPRLTVVTGVEPPDGWLGKPWALHQGSRLARGEILIIVDADILYSADAVAAAVLEFQRRGASMAALTPDFQMRGFWENVAMPMLPVAAFTFLPIWFSNRTTVARFGVGGGTGNLINRADYEAIGGHDKLKDAVVDDVALARLVRRSGRRSIVVRAENFVSVRMYDGLQEIIDGFTKNTFAAFGRSYLATFFFAAGGVLFHVYPYFAAMSGKVVAIATVVVISLTRLVLFAALRFNVLSALLAHPLMVLVWTWISLVSAWKTGFRRQLAWRGRTYDATRTKFGADR
jgi:chlorobactene glucosyltransferase